MARDSEREPSRIDIPCPTCGRRWVGHSNDPICPDCGASVSIRVHEEFALAEREGRTVAVSLSTADGRAPIEVASDN